MIEGVELIYCGGFSSCQNSKYFLTVFCNLFHPAVPINSNLNQFLLSGAASILLAAALQLSVTFTRSRLMRTPQIKTQNHTQSMFQSPYSSLTL